MRSLTPVTPDDLAHLACPYCGATTSSNAEWVAEAVQAWGLCGWRLAGETGSEAVILLAPSQSEPGSAMLKQLWVIPEQTGRGLGRRVIQGAAAGLTLSQTRAILSRGARTRPTCSAPPKEFLREVGFARQLEDRYYRLDLNRVVTTRNPLQVLLDKMAEVLRPGPGEPAAGGLSPRA